MRKNTSLIDLEGRSHLKRRSFLPSKPPLIFGWQLTVTFVQSICSIGRSKPLPYRLVRGCITADKMIICAKLFHSFLSLRLAANVNNYPLSVQRRSTCLTAVRSRLGSDSPPDCHSLPRRRFATSSDGGLICTHRRFDAGRRQ